MHYLNIKIRSYKSFSERPFFEKCKKIGNLEIRSYFRIRISKVLGNSTQDIYKELKKPISNRAPGIKTI